MMDADVGDLAESSELQRVIAALDPESKTLFAEAAIGRDAMEFFHSDLGRYLVGCAQQEYQEAMTKLKGTPWWMFWRVNALQNQAWRAEKFMVWLRDLILSGTKANLELADREEN